METDLISRSAAIEALNQHSYETTSDYDKTVELLNELPAVDAVPVVRCKDCFYRGLSDCPIFLAPDEGFCHIGSLTGD